MWCKYVPKHSGYPRRWQPWDLRRHNLTSRRTLSWSLLGANGLIHTLHGRLFWCALFVIVGHIVFISCHLLCVWCCMHWSKILKDWYHWYHWRLHFIWFQIISPSSPCALCAGQHGCQVPPGQVCKGDGSCAHIAEALSTLRSCGWFDGSCQWCCPAVERERDTVAT